MSETDIIQRIQADIVELFSRTNKSEVQVTRIETSLEFVRTDISNLKSEIKTSLNDFKEDIKELMGKSGKRYDKLVEAGLVIVLTIAINLLFKLK